MRLFFANGHGEAIFQGNQVAEFVIPPNCYVITTAVCGKKFWFDVESSLKEIIKDKELLQNLKDENTFIDDAKIINLKEALSYALAMGGETEDIHIRKPGDKMADIMFHPAASYNDEALAIFLPSGLIDLDSFFAKGMPLRSVTDSNFSYSQNDFAATVYPPGLTFDPSVKTVDDLITMIDKPIETSKLISSPGVYFLPICRSLPLQHRENKELRKIARERRAQSFGGKRRKTRKRKSRRIHKKNTHQRKSKTNIFLREV